MAEEPRGMVSIDTGQPIVFAQAEDASPDRAGHEIAAAIGARIRAARERRGWSQAELATRVYRTQTAVSYWESGSRLMGVDDLIRVAAALELHPSALLSDTTLMRDGHSAASGDLRKRHIEAATRWMLIYPLANWGILGCADGDAEETLRGIAKDLAAAWGADIALLALNVRDEELEQLRVEAIELRKAKIRAIDQADHEFRARRRAEATIERALANRSLLLETHRETVGVIVGQREEAEAERDQWKARAEQAIKAFDGTTPGAGGNSKLDALLQRAAAGQVSTDDAQNLGRIVTELLNRLARILAALAPCPHCGGGGAEPGTEAEGDWDSAAMRHHPYTAEPCSVCHGSGSAPQSPEGEESGDDA